MQMPAWLLKVVGKKVIEDGIEKSGISKSKLTAIIFVVVTAIQQLGPQFGHPVEIPTWVFQVLGAVGLWALKDGQPSK